MNSNRNSLERILALARRGWPLPTPPDEPPSAATIAFLARAGVAPSTRDARSTELWRMWASVGRWSLATATAVLLLVMALRPMSEAMANPFAPFTTDVTEDAFDLAPRL